MANGVEGPVTQRPFRIKVMNPSRAPRYLPKCMILGHVLQHSTRIVTLIDEEEASPDEVVETEDALAGRPDEPVEQSTD